jgi:hypothetical protein
LTACSDFRGSGANLICQVLTRAAAVETRRSLSLADAAAVSAQGERRVVTELLSKK